MKDNKEKKYVEQVMLQIAKHANQHIDRMEMLLIFRDELNLDRALGAGNSIYRAAFEILQEVANALKLSGGDEMWQVMQDGGLVRRVKFMEAVMLRYCLETTFSKRTDARNSVLKSSSGLLQSDLDWLVLDIDSVQPNKKQKR